MLIEFSLGNYRSFNDVQTLSFRATGLVSEKENKPVDENNIVEVGEQKLLKTIGVYGANASGKSNLIKGFFVMVEMVKWSLNREELTESIFEPNKQTSIALPEHYGYFQVVLLINGRRYRYGFTFNSNKQIEAEWLFGPALRNETYYFLRTQNEFKINAEYFNEGLDVPYATKLRSNTLFISFCSAYNGTVSSEIRSFLTKKVRFSGKRNSFLRTDRLVNSGNKEVVLTWLKEAGLIYSDISIIEDNPLISQVLLYKNLANGQKTVMNLQDEESQGTQKFYSLIGNLYEKFQHGGLYVCDEIDSNFHPALLRKIIGMFNNPVINKANAQLLFTSHDTNLMSPEIMRRDQFYFTEKAATDSTVLYSLADLKGIRNNADFAKQYLAGYYGALPMLGNYLEEKANAD